MKKIVALLFILSSFISTGAWAQRVVVITNADNVASEITKDQLQDFFFKRVRNWPDGKPVRFFDRQDNSSLRNKFLREYINRSARQIEQFWIGQKFNTGDSAPTQISSDSLMANLVSRFPGGIGYVQEGTPLPKDVKVLNVTDL